MSDPWNTCLLRSYCYWGQNFQGFDNRLSEILEPPDSTDTSGNELPEEKKVALLRRSIGGQVAEYFDLLTEGERGTYRDAMAALEARSQAFMVEVTKEDAQLMSERLYRSYISWNQCFQKFEKRLTEFLHRRLRLCFSANEVVDLRAVKIKCLRLCIGGPVLEYFESLSEKKKSTYGDAMAALGKQCFLAMEKYFLAKENENSETMQSVNNEILKCESQNESKSVSCTEGVVTEQSKKVDEHVEQASECGVDVGVTEGCSQISASFEVVDGSLKSVHDRT